jgi:hypothetical protein
VPLIQGSIVYPAIFDARRTLLSLPPIINGAHSAVGGARGVAAPRRTRLGSPQLGHACALSRALPTCAWLASPARPLPPRRPRPATPAPQISLDTRDVLIECTATDLTKAKVRRRGAARPPAAAPSSAANVRGVCLPERPPARVSTPSPPARPLAPLRLSCSSCSTPKPPPPHPQNPPPHPTPPTPPP